MIASLSGDLAFRAQDSIVVECGGVGYKVSVSARTLDALPETGMQVRLLCYTHVREDAFQVFGFIQPEERQVFEYLIAVSGVGPKLALTVLSGMSVVDLLATVGEADHKALQRIPGVGKKMAERLVVELRDRFAAFVADLAVNPEAAVKLPRPANNHMVEALVGLGYKRDLAEQAVAKVIREGNDCSQSDPEEFLRSALAAIAEA